jgi:hypothetical protein
LRGGGILSEKSNENAQNRNANKRICSVARSYEGRPGLPGLPTAAAQRAPIRSAADLQVEGRVSRCQFFAVTTAKCPLKPNLLEWFFQ